MRNLPLTIALLVTAVASGGDFDDANALYDEGKFAEARARYEAQIERGEGSANVFYNLANTEYRIGASGRAMLNYERALALAPSHPEARANLRLLREQSGAKLPARGWREAAFETLSLDGWTMVAAIAGWSAIFCFVAPLAAGRPPPAVLVFTGLLALACTTYAGLGIWRTARERDVAIVIGKKAEARLAPADRAALADVLPSGSRVRVLSERGPWVYCELPSLGLGWLPASAIEKVRLGKS